MNDFYDLEFTRIRTAITEKLRKMRRELPSASKDIDVLTFFFTQLKNLKEFERFQQMKPSSSRLNIHNKILKLSPGEVPSSNKEVPTKDSNSLILLDYGLIRTL